MNTNSKNSNTLLNFENFYRHYKIIENYQDKCPVDLITMAKDLGLVLYNIDTNDSISGAILRNKEEDKYEIYVKSSDHKNRKKFTIAHEIAHFLLHKDLIDAMSITDNAMYRSRLSNTYERQANRLASEIFIPIKKLLREYLFDKNIRNINKLAKKFEVSYEVMKIRIREGGNMFILDE